MFNVNSVQHNVSPRRALRLVMACFSLLEWGCASGETGMETSEARAQVQPPVEAQTDAGRPAPTQAEVTARGTGCPTGTWRTKISADGSKYSTTFSQYEATVDRQRGISVQGCDLTVRLRAEVPSSFAVSKILYSGYAYLERGVKGNQTLTPTFNDKPVAPVDKERRTDVVGPFDDRYRFEETISPEDLVWSQCGRDQTLQIFTRLTLQNGDPRNDGYLTPSLLYAPSDEIAWELTSRPCTEPLAHAGTSEATAD